MRHLNTGQVQKSEERGESAQNSNSEKSEDGSLEVSDLVREWYRG